MQGILRKASDLLSEYLNYFPAAAILGPRQCGKSTLIKQFAGAWNIFDLEKGSDYDYISADPDLFFRLNQDFTAIDEAQLFPALFKAMRSAIDSQRNKTGRYIITGSSSPELLKSISESLAGRIGIIELAPFSLSEIQGIKESPFFLAFTDTENFMEQMQQTKSSTELDLIHKYWFYGGYPEPWMKNDERFYELWQSQYIRTYIDRDISRLFPGLNSVRFRQFVEMLANLSGNILNYSEISRALGVSQTTIREYIRIAHGTFVWRQIMPYEKDAMKRIVKHPKGYLRDSGILHSILRIKDLRQLLTHPIMGKSWESMVTEQILRGLEWRGIPFNYYYYRTSAGAEIDLILEGKFGLIPVEIKYNQTVKSSELRAIHDFIDERKCLFGIVIHNGERITVYSSHLIGIPFSFII